MNDQLMLNVAIAIRKVTIFVVKTAINTSIFLFLLFLLIEAYKVSIWFFVGTIVLFVSIVIIIWAFDKTDWLYR